MSSPITTIQGTLMACMQCSKNNFNVNITTQPTTHRTLFCPNIVQLLKKNKQIAITKSFASMQQHCRPIYWVVVIMSNILLLEIRGLQQTSDMESSNDYLIIIHNTREKSKMSSIGFFWFYTIRVSIWSFLSSSWLTWEDKIATKDFPYDGRYGIWLKATTTIPWGLWWIRTPMVANIQELTHWRNRSWWIEIHYLELVSKSPFCNSKLDFEGLPK